MLRTPLNNSIYYCTDVYKCSLIILSVIYSVYGARGSDNSDDKMWFGGEKVGVDHNMKWFQSEK